MKKKLFLILMSSVATVHGVRNAICLASGSSLNNKYFRQYAKFYATQDLQEREQIFKKIDTPITEDLVGVLVKGIINMKMFFGGMLLTEWRTKRKFELISSKQQIDVSDVEHLDRNVLKCFLPNQNSLLHLAICRGDIDVLKSLANSYLREGLLDSVKSHQNNQGETLLHAAVQENCIDMVGYVLHEIGVNPYTVNNQGETAFEFAEQHGRREILEIITQYQIAKHKQESNPWCFICFEERDDDEFSLCDYKCLTPICVECKNLCIAHSENSNCPNCRIKMCDTLDN